MPPRRLLFMLCFLLSPPASAAEFDYMQLRIDAARLTARAADNERLNRAEVTRLCQGAYGGRWCEGYISAILNVYQIPQNCLPITDMAPFRNGQVWEMARDWSATQPEGSTFTFFELITQAIEDQDRCPMGEILLSEAPPLIPYSEAELIALRSTNDFLPIEEVIPEYPPLARERGIEGWTMVRFSVNESGTVENVVLDDADPPEIFDEVSIEAARMLRYPPPVVRGQPRRVDTVLHVFRFNLDQQ